MISIVANEFHTTSNELKWFQMITRGFQCSNNFNLFQIISENMSTDFKRFPIDYNAFKWFKQIASVLKQFQNSANGFTLCRMLPSGFKGIQMTWPWFQMNAHVFESFHMIWNCVKWFPTSNTYFNWFQVSSNELTLLWMMSTVSNELKWIQMSAKSAKHICPKYIAKKYTKRYQTIYQKYSQIY